MKKIICILMALLIMGSPSFAQNKVAQPPVKKNTTPTAKDAAKVKATEVKPAATKMKKDGTPDMRYKENKDAAKPAGPLKKDGTPDKRYKANKDAAKPAKKN